MNGHGHFEKVIIGSGHMIDLPGRPTPRFPPENEKGVRTALATVLDGWEIGPVDLALTGGARGADILFAELCLDRGATVRLVLALPEEEFLTSSVRLEGSDWEERYIAIRGRCELWFQH